MKTRILLYMIIQMGTGSSAPASSQSKLLSSSSSNWSRFRGPNGAGISRETGLPTQWSDSTNMVWKRPLPGHGASSPVTFGDRIFLTCYSGYGLSEQSTESKGELTYHLLCLNRSDGSVVWEEKTEPTGNVADYNRFMALHGYACACQALVGPPWTRAYPLEKQTLTFHSSLLAFYPIRGYNASFE
jgi:hypothetical protein